MFSCTDLLGLYSSGIAPLLCVPRLAYSRSACHSQRGLIVLIFVFPWWARALPLFWRPHCPVPSSLMPHSLRSLLSPLRVCSLKAGTATIALLLRFFCRYGVGRCSYPSPWGCFSAAFGILFPHLASFRGAVTYLPIACRGCHGIVCRLGAAPTFFASTFCFAFRLTRCGSIYVMDFICSLEVIFSGVVSAAVAGKCRSSWVAYESAGR